MKTNQVGPFLLALGGALSACRGIVGIEELSLVAAAVDAPPEAGVDGSIANDADALVEPADVEAQFPADPACTAAGSVACGPCCRQRYGDGFAELEGNARATGCVCGGAACTAECAATLCTQLPGMDANCGGCVDRAIRDPNSRCVAARNGCAGSPKCARAYGCLNGCPPPP